MVLGLDSWASMEYPLGATWVSLRTSRRIVETMSHDYSHQILATQTVALFDSLWPSNDNFVYWRAHLSENELRPKREYYWNTKKDKKVEPVD